MPTRPLLPSAQVVTLHFGVIDRNIGACIAVVDQLTNGLSFPARDGDGWEAWGERPGLEGNDPNTLHIQVDVLDSESEALAYALAKSEIAPRLVPMQIPRQAGTIIAITDAHDWSITRFVLKSDGSVPIASQSQTCPDPACRFTQDVARVALDGRDIANGSKWPCVACNTWHLLPGTGFQKP